MNRDSKIVLFSYSEFLFCFVFGQIGWPTSRSMQSFINIQFVKWKNDWIYWIITNWYPGQMAVLMWQSHLNLCYLMPNNAIYTKSVSFTISNENACQPFNLYSINGLRNKWTKGTQLKCLFDQLWSFKCVFLKKEYIVLTWFRRLKKI